MMDESGATPSGTDPAPAAQPASAARRRVLAYDALRGFSMLSVVAIHCLIPLRGVLPERSVAMVVDDLLHYAVPAFVFISGALVWGRWTGGSGALRRLVRGRLANVGAPYVAWALLYLGIVRLSSPDAVRQAGRVVGLLLTGHVWYHLYFIPMLVGFYLLTPLMAPLFKRWPEAALLTIYSLRIVLWPPASLWLRDEVGGLTWSYATHFATHLPHMALGAWFAHRLSAFPTRLGRSWPLLLATGVALLLVRSLGLLTQAPDGLTRLIYPLGMAATVLGLALAAFELEPHYDRFEHAVVAGATLSFGVYFVHPLLLFTLQQALKAAGLTGVWSNWWAVPAAWTVVGAASYAVAWKLARTPRTGWLIGVRAAAGG